MSEIRKEQTPDLFVPSIDRTKCEGGYHHACADAKCPCVPACPYGVLEIRPLTAADRRLLSLGERFRAWVHRNRQAYVVKADACTAYARCVQVGCDGEWKQTQHPHDLAGNYEKCLREGLRKSKTATARGALPKLGRDGETPPSRTEKHRSRGLRGAV